MERRQPDQGLGFATHPVDEDILANNTIMSLEGRASQCSKPAKAEAYLHDPDSFEHTLECSPSETNRRDRNG